MDGLLRQNICSISYSPEDDPFISSHMCLEQQSYMRKKALFFSPIIVTVHISSAQHAKHQICNYAS